MYVFLFLLELFTDFVNVTGSSFGAKNHNLM